MSRLLKASLAAVDVVSGFVGYAAVRDWSPAPTKGEKILDLVAYSQVNSFSCGAVAGFQIVKSVYPESKFADFYQAVKPDPVIGTPARNLTRALREFGVSVSPRRNLSTAHLKRCIRRRSYVIVSIRNPGADYHHWVVAHGYARSHVVIAGNGLPWLHRRRIAWGHFEGIWNPYGNGLICSEEE